MAYAPYESLENSYAKISHFEKELYGAMKVTHCRNFVDI